MLVFLNICVQENLHKPTGEYFVTLYTIGFREVSGLSSFKNF